MKTQILHDHQTLADEIQNNELPICNVSIIFADDLEIPRARSSAVKVIEL